MQLKNEKPSKLFQYADDTTVFGVSKTLDSGKDILERNVENVLSLFFKIIN